MSTRIIIFTALSLLAGNASANFFDDWDMGNFFGNTYPQPMYAPTYPTYYPQHYYAPAPGYYLPPAQ